MNGMGQIFDRLVEQAKDIQFHIEKDPMDLNGMSMDIQLEYESKRGGRDVLFISRTNISPQKDFPPHSSWFMVFLELIKTLSQRLKESKDYYGDA
jgi:hypothetical protein